MGHMNVTLGHGRQRYVHKPACVSNNNVRRVSMVRNHDCRKMCNPKPACGTTCRHAGCCILGVVALSFCALQGHMARLCQIPYLPAACRWQKLGTWWPAHAATSVYAGYNLCYFAALLCCAVASTPAGSKKQPLLAASRWQRKNDR